MNGLDCNAAKDKFIVPESVGVYLPEKKEKLSTHWEKKLTELPNVNCQRPSSPSVEKVTKTKPSGEAKSSNQRSTNISHKKKPGNDGTAVFVHSMHAPNNSSDAVENESAFDASELRGDNETLLGSNYSSKNLKTSSGCLHHGLAPENVIDGTGSFDTTVSRSLGASALTTLKVAVGWRLTAMTTILLGAHDYILYFLRWLVHFGKIILLLPMVWLDCCFRSICSFLCPMVNPRLSGLHETKLLGHWRKEVWVLRS